MAEQYKDRLHLTDVTSDIEIKDALVDRIEWLKALMIAINDIVGDPDQVKALADLGISLVCQVEELRKRQPGVNGQEKARRKIREEQEREAGHA